MNRNNLELRALSTKIIFSTILLTKEPNLYNID